MITSNAVVVAVDGSTACQVALRWAAVAAIRRRRPLYIAAFWSVPALVPAASVATVSAAVRGEAEDHAAAARALAAQVAPDLAVELVVREGHPVEELLEISRNAALIVMGARGLGVVTGAVLGSVSAAVVSHAACPVVVLREDWSADDAVENGPVVVGVDGSEVSRAAAEAAFREADVRRVAVVAVNSWMDRQIYASPAALQAAQEYAETTQREQEAMLRRFMLGLARRYPDITLRQVVTRSEPLDALVRESAQAQLLVVGSHGRGRLLATALGSTSRALLQRASCPVMVVRPGS